MPALVVPYDPSLALRDDADRAVRQIRAIAILLTACKDTLPPQAAAGVGDILDDIADSIDL